MASSNESNVSKVIPGAHKSNTRKLLLAIYEQYGIATAYEKAHEIIKQCEDTKYNRDKRSAVKGELAEVVLEIFCIHLQKILPSTIVSKGLCIYKQGDKRVTTEMDLILFTPFCMYMFECKSYSGKKVLTEECYLKAMSTKDVYRQSKYHFEILWPYVSKFVLKSHTPTLDNPVVKLILFELSSGDIDDQRTAKNKALYPCLTLDNILAWAQKEFGRTRTVIYDMKGLDPVIKQLDAGSAATFEKHLARLKGSSRNG